VVAGGPELDAVGLVTRSVAFVTAGAIAGRFSDRMRAARAREQRLLDSGLVLNEIRTSAALAAAVADAALQTPGAVGSAAAIDGHASAARGRPGHERTTMPIMARRERVGSITVIHDAALRPEDQAALELLALQAGLAADNQRLLVREREAAALAALLGRRHGLPSGTFVFVVSDFLAAHPDDVWARAIERRWDLVPVIVQDSRWERSFPDVAGAVLPVADPVTGRVSLTRLSRAQVDRRRAENEACFSALVARFAQLGLDPVLVSSEGPRGLHAAFLRWADRRARARTWLP
jgi:hypothetical protein